MQSRIIGQTQTIYRNANIRDENMNRQVRGKDKVSFGQRESIDEFKARFKREKTMRSDAENRMAVNLYLALKGFNRASAENLRIVASSVKPNLGKLFEYSDRDSESSKKFVRYVYDIN